MDDLIIKAVSALREQTDLEVETTRAETRDGETHVNVKTDDQRVDFGIEVKKHLSKGTARHLVTRQNTRLSHFPRLLISEYINPSVGKLLQEHEIYYLDTAGNCYLKGGDLFVLITGLKLETNGEKKPSRAFREAGLKLIFVLLSNPDLTGKTYRELANLAGISRGAVGYVISDLKEMGYILEVQRGRRKLRNKEELIEKWTTNYGETLRPKLVRGRFRLLKDIWRKEWKNATWNPLITQWGGEPAGDILTQYLKPEIFTLYTRENTKDILTKVHAVPDSAGNLEILDMFWDPEKINGSAPANAKTTVPPLLVYADLIDSGDERNIETSKRLYEQYITDRE